MSATAAPTFIDIRVSGWLKKKRSRDVLWAIENGMLLGARLAVPRVRSFTPVDRTFLINGWQVNMRKRPRRVMIVNTNAPGKVGAMERGRRAGAKFPPVGAIRGWVNRKLGLTGSKMRSVAYLIGRKIHLRGIKVPLQVSGKGAMLARTVRFLGAGFFANIVANEVRRLR